MDTRTFPQLMVAVATQRLVDDVLQHIVRGLAACRDVVLARIWLLRPGDICETCPLRSECTDKTLCLQLVASAGNPKNPSDNYASLDGQFRRFPMGVRKVGTVAQSGQSLLLTNLDAADQWIARPDWIRQQGVHTMAAQPLIYNGQTVGVLAVFDRGKLAPEDVDWLRIFADHAAVSLTTAEALEEVERLRQLLQQENEYLRDELDDTLGLRELLGHSPAFTKVLQQVDLVAATDATVLIGGESGTGKELIARAVHQRGKRRNKALIKVNCGAIPEGLFESELFGHTKGAFTGALRDRIGRFELADGGTLFLDEIGELPLSAQAKLLRAIQEQEVERVGESKVRKVNVRFIAATNRDLVQECEAGRFRQDLFYRLSVFPIEVPPLRERPEDIATLARHFIGQTAKRLKRTPPTLDAEHLAQLRAYPWPGNVRELQNVTERAMIVASGKKLEFHFPRARGGTSERPVAVPASTLTRAELRDKERHNIVAALDTCKGRVFGASGAAALLGMKPTTLASRIKALKIIRPKAQ